jgi:hypothetical protein
MTLHLVPKIFILLYLILRPVHTGLYLVRKGDYPDGHPLFVFGFKIKC